MATPVGGLIPAELETRLLRLVEGEVQEIEVAAWQISAISAVPITAAGLHGGFRPNDYVVEFGRGEIFEPGQRSWMTRADWLEALTPRRPPAAF